MWDKIRQTERCTNTIRSRGRPRQSMCFFLIIDSFFIRKLRGSRTKMNSWERGWHWTQFKVPTGLILHNSIIMFLQDGYTNQTLHKSSRMLLHLVKSTCLLIEIYSISTHIKYNISLSNCQIWDIQLAFFCQVEMWPTLLKRPIWNEQSLIMME